MDQWIERLVQQAEATRLSDEQLLRVEAIEKAVDDDVLYVYDLAILFIATTQENADGE